MDEQLIQMKENLYKCRGLAGYLRQRAHTTMEYLGLPPGQEMAEEKLKPDSGFIPEANLLLDQTIEELGYAKEYINIIADTFAPDAKVKAK